MKKNIYKQVHKDNVTIELIGRFQTLNIQKVMITQGGVYLPGKRASLPVLEIGDPDPRIFTGIQIRDPREKQCGSPTLLFTKENLGTLTLHI